MLDDMDGGMSLGYHRTVKQHSRFIRSSPRIKSMFRDDIDDDD